MDFLLPPLCFGCGGFDESRRSVCDDCLMRMDRFARPLCVSCLQLIPKGLYCPRCGESGLPLFALGDYTEPLREVVIHFKFRGFTRPAAVLAQLLWEQFDELLAATGASVAIPVPLHFMRRLGRGYNQAAVFARALGVRWDLTVDEDTLVRRRRRRPQARLNLRQRAVNIHDVFEVIRPAREQTPVLLVDDVITSGATVLEARRVLEAAGYQVCGAAAIAHGM